MKEERMKVLEMLQDGKITAEDAAKLLESMRYHRHHFSGNEGNIEEALTNFSQQVTTMAKELSDKVSDAFKTTKPKMQEITKAVVSKTADVADNISKALNDSIKQMDSQCNCGCGCQEDESCACNSQPEAPVSNGEKQENKTENQ